MNVADIPNFNGYRAPSDAGALDRARSQIATNFAQLDIPMTLASTAFPGNSNGWVVFNIAGTTLYVDTDPTLGNAVASLQFNSQQDAGAAKFYAQAGQNWESLTFKQVALSWAAQPGKIMRLMYSMDGRVFPSNAGASVAATIANAASAPVPVSEQGIVFGASFKSMTSLVAGTPENVWSAAANVNGVIVFQAEYMAQVTPATGAINFACKATAPTTPTDGTVIATNSGGWALGTAFFSVLKLNRAINVLPALRGDFGLWGGVTETLGYRNCLYTLK